MWQAEAQRLGAVLAAFPTSQAQDQALLAAGRDDAGGPADWQTRRILEFRVERKRALRCGAAPALGRLQFGTVAARVLAVRHCDFVCLAVDM